jgi:hypothetical protein
MASSQFTWTTGGDRGLNYIRKMAVGGFSEVHEVRTFDSRSLTCEQMYDMPNDRVRP